MRAEQMMRTEQIVRAWKDEDYRLSLTEVERSLLPEHPAGIVELPDDMLDDVGGAATTVVSPIQSPTLSIICTADVMRSLDRGGSCACGTLGCCG